VGVPYSLLNQQARKEEVMPKNRRIRLIGKQAAFNAEVWARAVEALARQLQREAAAKGPAGEPKPPGAKPEAGS
jgi:hypothetical protein